jgi:spermidine/putrescine transport system substrate-binding protein
MICLMSQIRRRSIGGAPHAPVRHVSRPRSSRTGGLSAINGEARTILFRAPSLLVSLAVLLAALVLGPGCSPKGEKGPPVAAPQQPPEEVPAPEQPAPPAMLRVLCDSGYLPEGLLADFAAQTGVTVVVANPSDHPDISASGASFDLALVDSRTLSSLIDEGMLKPIDGALISNIGNVSPPFSTDPFDPDEAYSVPFLWGTFGIVLNRDFLTADDIEWDVLFDRTYSGKIDMPDDIRLVVEAALRDLGSFLEEADIDTLNAAADRLLEQRKIVRGYFQVPEIIDHMADNSSYVSFLDSRSAADALKTSASLEYIVPESGAPLWLLVWVIPAASENADAAVRFIDFLLDPKRIAAVSNASGIANTVGGSTLYLDEALAGTPTIILPEGVSARCRLPGPIDLETENFIMRLKDDLM